MKAINNYWKNKYEKEKQSYEEAQEQIRQLEEMQQQTESQKLFILRKELAETRNLVQDKQDEIKKLTTKLSSLWQEYEVYQKKSEENKSCEMELVKAKTELDLRQKFYEELERAKGLGNNQSLSEMSGATRRLVREKESRINDLKDQVQASREFMDKSLVTIRAINTSSIQEESSKTSWAKINVPFFSSLGKK